jgi:hypothetical protein
MDLIQKINIIILDQVKNKKKIIPPKKKSMSLNLIKVVFVHRQILILATLNQIIKKNKPLS